MKRILLAAAVFLGLSGAVEAACPATFGQMKDNAGSNFNMGLASDLNGNCNSYMTLLQGSALIAAGNPLFVSPGTGAIFQVQSNSANLATQTTAAAILTALGTPFQAGGSIANTTFAATQSGTWNITNVSGTVSLPTGASTAALQPTNAAIASTTSGQTGHVMMGAVTTAAPTYTTAQTDPLSLTTAGALRVDGSGVTQPVSLTSTTITGSVTVAQATAGSLNATVVGTGTFAVQAAQSGTWNVTNISGTVSLPTGASTSALQPTNAAIASTTAGQTGHLIMGAVTTSAPTYTTAQSDPLSLTTAGALRVDGSGVTQPVSLTSTTITGSVTVAQATAGSLNATVVGTGTFAVQATLQASASTAIGKVDPNTIATWGLVVSTQNSATPTNMALMAGQFNTTPTTITSGNVSALQLDSAGNLLVNIKTGASSGAVAQGSTTSGQTGGLIQAAVTTSAPTYTTAQTNPLSMDTSGNLRVTVAAAIGLAQGSTTSGQTGSMIMGAVTTSAPTYTTAQTSPISLDTAGNIRINCVTGCAGGTLSNASSAVATTSTNLGVVSYNYGFNGTTWDQLQVDGSKNLKVIVNAAIAAGTNLIGKMGLDQTTPGTTNGTQDASTGSTGSAPPSKAAYTGANGSGNLTGEIVCDSFITYDASTNGSTQLVALSSGKSIYVCGYSITTGATATNVKLIYGTGTACVTSPQPVTPAYQLGINSGIVDHGSNHWSGMKTAASQELCLNTSAGNPVQATVYYTQF